MSKNRSGSREKQRKGSESKGQENKNPIHGYFTRQNTNNHMAATSEKTPGQNNPVTNSDLKQLIEKLDDKLSAKMEAYMTTINEKIADVDRKCDDMIVQTNERVGEIETSLQFMSDKIDDFKNNDDIIKQLTDRISKLEEQSLYQESRSRKYNLLFYGIPERISKGGPETEEKTEELLRAFIHSEMGIDKDTLSEITIANAHRIPKRKKLMVNGATTPNPIIAKFVRFRDRNFILGNAKNINKNRKISVRTDLPAVLKEKRYKLAKIAYRLRNKDGMKTFIKETNNDVYLQYKEDLPDAKWKKYNYKEGDEAEGEEE